VQMFLQRNMIIFKKNSNFLKFNYIALASIDSLLLLSYLWSIINYVFVK